MIKPPSNIPPIFSKFDNLFQSLSIVATLALLSTPFVPTIASAATPAKPSIKVEKISKVKTPTQLRLQAKLTEATKEQAFEVDWSSSPSNAKVVADELNNQVLEKYPNAAELSKVNFALNTAQMYYSFSGAFVDAGQTYLIENINSRSTTPEAKFKAISKLADSLISEQANNLNAVLAVNVSYWQTSPYNNIKNYSNINLSAPAATPEHVAIYKQTLLRAIKARANANFIANAGRYNANDKNYEAVELNAQRCYQDLLDIQMRLKLNQMVANKDKASYQQFVGSIKTDIATLTDSKNQNISTLSSISGISSSSTLPTNEYYFHLRNDQRVKLQRKFAGKLVVLLNELE